MRGELGIGYLLVGGLIAIILSAIALAACSSGEEVAGPPEPTPRPYCYLTFFDPRGDHNDITVKSFDLPGIEFPGDEDGVILRFGPSRVQGAYDTPYNDARKVPGLTLGMAGGDGFFSIERLSACGGG